MTADRPLRRLVEAELAIKLDQECARLARYTFDDAIGAPGQDVTFRTTTWRRWSPTFHRDSYRVGFHFVDSLACAQVRDLIGPPWWRRVLRWVVKRFKLTSR